MMYRVTWEIDIDADTPIEAAKKALEIQRDPNSSATVFTCRDEFGNEIWTDLTERETRVFPHCGKELP